MKINDYLQSKSKHERLDQQAISNQVANNVNYKEAPSLRGKFNDAQWLDVVWSKAVLSAENETNLEGFPESCPWTMEQVLDPTFLPE